MKHSLTVAAVALGALAAPATASAMLTDIGKPATQIPAACPGKPCLAVSRTTGFQAKEGDSRAVDVVPADGRIVAWSITLSDPGTKQTKFFNENLGGEATAQLTIVRPGRKLYYRVIAQGEPQKLTPYFGQTVAVRAREVHPGQEGHGHRPERPDLGPGARREPARDDLVARVAQEGHVRRLLLGHGPDGREQRHALLLPVPHRAPALLGHAGHRPAGDGEADGHHADDDSHDDHPGA